METKKNPVFRVKVISIKTGESKTSTLYGGDNENTKPKELLKKMIEVLK